MDDLYQDIIKMASHYITVQLTPAQAQFLLVTAFKYPVWAFMAQPGAGPMELVEDDENDQTEVEDQTEDAVEDQAEDTVEDQ
jgi:hypothetical protein